MHASLMSPVFLNPVKGAIQITHHRFIPYQLDIHTFLSQQWQSPVRMLERSKTKGMQRMGTGIMESDEQSWPHLPCRTLRQHSGLWGSGLHREQEQHSRTISQPWTCSWKSPWNADKKAIGFFCSLPHLSWVMSLCLTSERNCFLREGLGSTIFMLIVFRNWK